MELLFLFALMEGNHGYSIGTNLLELQNIFEKFGAYNAANLDGGSSATMYYNGKVVNKTSTPMGERYLPNAFIVEKQLQYYFKDTKVVVTEVPSVEARIFMVFPRIISKF